MFEGFNLSVVDTGDAALRVRYGVKGPPVLLLARDFTVVAADLRGYGQSSKPASTPDHLPYSKPVLWSL